MADDPAAGILAKLEAILSRVPKIDDDDGGSGGGKAVPYERFFAVNQRAKAAEGALADMKTEVAGLRTSHAKALEEATKAAAAEVGKLAQRHTEDLALVDAGLDGDGREAVRLAWSRQPEATRPASPVDWWKAQTEAYKAHQADPEKVAAPELPRTLTPYLPTPAATKPSGESRQSTGAGGAAGGVIAGRMSPDRGVVVGPRPGQAATIRGAKSLNELMAVAQEIDSQSR